MTKLTEYEINIKTPIGIKQGFILEANLEDMPKNWDFNWLYIWNLTDFDVQNIVKLVYENEIYGLVRYTKYETEDIPLIEIEHIEANPRSRHGLDLRLVDPIGKWLIWYVSNIAIQNENIDDSETVIVLSSNSSAVDYYHDIIKMEYLGNSYRSTGDDDGYAFRFTRKHAKSFCSNQERNWGKPTLIKP